MAKKIIKHEDLFEPKITKGIVKELDDLIKKGNETEDTLKGILKVLQDIDNIKTAEEFKAFTDESEKLNKAQKELVDTEKKLAKVQEKIIADIEKQAKANKELSKTEKDKIKLTEKLKAANSSAIEDNEVLKIQLQQQNKANKELAREKLGLVDTYEKESKRLIKLRKEYKSLRLEQGKDTKETKALKEEINELDEALKEVDADVGQFQRSVGDYTNSIKEAGSATGKQGLSTAFAFLAGAAVSAFGESRDEARKFNILLEQIKNSAITVGFAVIDFFQSKVIPTISNFINNIKAGILNLQISANELASAFGSDTATANLKTQREELKNINAEIEENSKLIASAKNPFEGIIDRIGESNEVLKEQLELEDEIINRTIELTIQIEKLAGEEERLAAAAGDGTTSFAQQTEALEEALTVQEKRLNLQRELATEQQKAAVLAVRNDLIRRGESDKVTDDQIRDLSFIKDRALADKASIESLQRVAEANLQILALDEEILNFARESGQVRREISRDTFEKQLDFAIDAFDSIKTLREREIADTNIEFTDRVDKLSQLKTLAESSFKSQVELIGSITNQKVDLNELVKIEDERILRAKLINESSIVDEIILQRILEAVRERRTVTRDILDAEQGLTDELTEQQKAAESLANDIDQTRRQGAIDAEEDARENRRKREKALIAQAQFETSIAKEGTDEKILIAEQLKNDLAAIDRERQKEIEGSAAKALKTAQDLAAKKKEENTKLVNAISDATIEGLDKRNEAENKRLSGQVQDQESSLSIQEQRAKDGLSNTLAFEQQELDKARLRQQQELERQAKQQEIIALIQAYYNQFQSLSSNPETADTAAIKAFTNTLLAKSIAKGLTGFIEGTELVERDMQGSKFSSGQDGYLAKFDGKERILNPAQNMALPKGMTNRELVKAAQDYASGNTWGFMPTVSQTTDSGATTKAIIASNNKVIKAIENNAASMSVDSEGLMHIIEQRVSRGKKELIHFINKKYKMLPK